MALLGGAYYSKRILSYLVPILSLYISDLFLNNFVYRSFFPENEGIVWFSDFMIYTYLGTLGVVILGRFVLSKITLPRMIGGALAASILFFLVSNFGVWIASTSLFPKNISGLLSCYAAGLPFLQTSIIGNLVFTLVLFTGYEVLTQKELSFVKVN